MRSSPLIGILKKLSAIQSSFNFKMKSKREIIAIRQNVNVVVYPSEREREREYKNSRKLEGNRRDGIEKWTERVTEQ